MDIFYRNHLGQSVNFMDWPYKISESDFFDYEWSYEKSETLNPRVSRIYWELKEKSMKLSISSGNEEAYHNALNHLLSVFELDVIDESCGRLYIGRNYVNCYIMSSKKSDWCPGTCFLVNEFSVLCESAWIKETPYSFEAKALSLSNVKKYAYKYPYRYSISAGENFVENSHYADCNFKLRIYGPCVNPHIIIGTHRYQVWTILTAGEWLEIDSIHNKVYKVMVNGTKVSLFNERDKLSSVFEKIPPGRQRVAAPGTFNFDLVLYEERSEPEWV